MFSQIMEQNLIKIAWVNPGAHHREVERPP